MKKPIRTRRIMFLNCVMKLYRNVGCRTKARALLPRVAAIPITIVLAALAIHSCCGAGTNAGGSEISPTAKVAARAGTLRVVEHRSPTGVSARILDGERLVFDGLVAGGGLLLVQPAGRSVVSYRESKRENGRMSLTGGNTNGLSFSESFRQVAPDLIERTVLYRPGMVRCGCGWLLFLYRQGGGNEKLHADLRRTRVRWRFVSDISFLGLPRK